MNILFLGNSLLLTSLRKLPQLLNTLPQKDVFIKLIYIGSGRIYTYVDYFKEPMTKPFILKVPSRIWTYTYGSKHWKEQLNPMMSIKDVLLEREWDVIITCGHTYEKASWLYDKYKDTYEKYFSLLRNCSDADIYWTWIFTPSYTAAAFLEREKLKYFVPDTYEDMYELLNEVDERICTDNNVKSFPLRLYYNELIKVFPGHRNLMYDHIHPDRGIGEYFCSALIYDTFLKSIYGVEVKNIRYTYDASAWKYKNVDADYKETPSAIPSVSVTPETKKIADKIIESHLF